MLMRSTIEYPGNETVPPNRATPLREIVTQPESYSGEKIEQLLLGNPLFSLDYTDHSRRGNLSAVSRYEQYRSFLRTHGSDPSFSRILEDRNGKLVFKKPVALAMALGLYSDKGITFVEHPAKPKLPPFACVLETYLNQKNSSSLKQFSFIPTVDTPFDFDYGADAIIHSASSGSDYRDLVNDKFPLVSLGVTSFDKRKHQSTTKRTDIHSDIELFVPPTTEFVDRLANPLLPSGKFDPLVLTIIAELAEATSQILQEKINKQTVKARWIDCAEIAARRP